MRRRLLLSAAALVAIACVVLLVLAMLPRRGVMEANIDRIEVGMTKGQVEQVLGQPPIRDHEFAREYGVWRGFRDVEAWDLNGGGFLLVTFSNGVVWDTRSIREESLSEKVRRWLGVAQPPPNIPTPPTFPPPPTAE